VGSYSSALAVTELAVPPPVTRTVPFASKVAVAPKTPVGKLAAADHEFVVGLYSSALETMLFEGSKPPTTSTNPFGSNVAVCAVRATSMFPAGDQVLDAGSYSSALPLTVPVPPAAKTFPDANSVAVKIARGVARLPVTVH
jgi:hypothetical protein